MIEATQRFAERFVVLIGTPISYRAFRFSVDEKRNAQNLFNLACELPRVPVTWIDTETGIILRRPARARRIS